MKKISLKIIVFLMVFGAFSAKAQENTFNQEDFLALLRTASQKLNGKTYRLKTNSVFYSDGNPVPRKAEKTVREIVPPDREHYFSETKTAEGVNLYEFIRVGQRQFVRVGSGDWKESEIGTGSGIGRGSGIGGGNNNVKVEKNVERKLKKGETVNNQITDLYETIITTGYIYPEKTVTEVSRNSYWFDASGMYVKIENEYQNSERKISSMTTKEYEYDANIKIEAPLISSSTKP